MKLDYEQQCYRHSEMIVRMRLQQLQNSLEDANKATSVPKLKRWSRQRGRAFLWVCYLLRLGPLAQAAGLFILSGPPATAGSGFRLLPFHPAE